MIRYITVDLDSTLYDTMHRHHMIDRVNGTDWVAYGAACMADTVIEGVRNLIYACQEADIEVFFVTGRVEATREQTEKKLAADEITHNGLIMDETYDHSVVYGSHAAYKVHQVTKLREKHLGTHLFHMDDYAEVAVELAKLGIPCICVRAPHELVGLTSSLA